MRKSIKNITLIRKTIFALAIVGIVLLATTLIVLFSNRSTESLKEEINSFNDDVGMISFQYPRGWSVTQLDAESNSDDTNAVAVKRSYSYKVINREDENTFISIGNSIVDYTNALGGSGTCEFGYFKFDGSLQDDFIVLTNIGDTEFVLKRDSGTVYEVSEEGYSDTLYEFNDKNYPVCREIAINVVAVTGKDRGQEVVKTILETLNVNQQ